MRIHPIIPLWIIIPILMISLLPIIKKFQKKNLSIIFLCLCLFLLNLRIQIKTDSLAATANNLDVLFVIDTTISMNAEDGFHNQTRLENIRTVTRDIIEELSGARFSVVEFDNSARIVIPFVKDTNLAIESIESLYPMEEFYARGSSLNKPIEIMKKLLSSAKKKEDRVRIVFFLSDGEITNDEKLASYADLKPDIDGGAVLGFGTTNGGRMKVKDEYTGTEEYLTYYDEHYNQMDAVSKIDENNLQKIAQDLNIDYIHVTDEGSLDKKVQEISKKAIRDSEEDRDTGYEDTYFIWIFPIMILLLLEFKKL